MNKVASELTEQSATELIAGFARKTFSPVEVLHAVLDRAEQLNSRLNAIFYIDREKAVADAKLSEDRWFKGQPCGELDGVPLTVKDSIAVRGMPMFRGSQAYEGSGVSVSDSPPASRLIESGAVVFGKTTMPDLGMFPAGVSSAYGVARNPWNTAFNTGGSSSGGAAAVAAGIGPLTVGSDIGGSLRLPSSLCGLTTIKPTQGRIPHLPASPIRSAGPIARTAQDAALLFTVLAGADARDGGSLPPDGVIYHTQLDASMKGKRIGIMLDMGFGKSVDEAVRKAIISAAEVFQQGGAELVIMPPLLNFNPMPLLDTLFSVRTTLELEHITPDKREKVHPFIRELCAKSDGMNALSYARMMEKIEKTKSEIMDKTSQYDFILSPTLPVVNFPAENLSDDPGNPFSVIPFTCLFNQTGQPAAVVCCGFDERGLPIGLQLVGNRFDDLLLLQAAHWYEKHREWDMPWDKPSVSVK